MVRKIVFLGNCQANSIHRLFAEAIAPVTGDIVGFVACFAELTEDSARLCRDADLVVSQIFDSNQLVSLSNLRRNGQIRSTIQIVEFPFISGAFLWPNAGSGHPLNMPLPYFTAGPFSQEFGDKYLNREILRGSDPNTVTQSYQTLDTVNLDRLYELHRMSLQKKDDRSGFDFADYIDNWFQKESLFRTPTTLDRRLFLYVASMIFKKIGIDENLIDRICANTWTLPNADVQLPLHPSVVGHFGLRFVNSGTRYRYYTGEDFTFDQYIYNYLRFSYNELLFSSIFLKDKNSSSVNGRKVAIARIRVGLLTSEGSAGAYFELSNHLAEQGDLRGCWEAIEKAYKLCPSNVRYQVFFASRLKEAGDLGRAEDVLKKGLVEWPGVAVLWRSFADILRRRDKLQAAIEAFKEATRIEPKNANFHNEMASCLLQDEQLDKALEAARVAVGLDAGNPHYAGLVGQIALRIGDIETAKTSFRSASHLAPESPAFVRELAHCFGLQNNFHDASYYMRRAVSLDPSIAENNAILGHILSSDGQMVEAEGFLRQAVNLAPDDAKYQELLASFLVKYGSDSVSIQMIDEDGLPKVMIGKADWLFLINDSNQTIEQYCGNLLFNSDQLSSWTTELEWRRDFFVSKKIPYLLLVAPNKECVYEHLLPNGFNAGHFRPIDQFLAIAKEIVPTCYPLDRFRGLRADMLFDKVDTHWTVLGALTACIDFKNTYESAYGSLSVEFSENDHRLLRFQSSGDLGQKFTPPRVAQRLSLDPATKRGILVSDNGVNNHGNVKTFSNEKGNGKKCLIFGDSFGLNLAEIIKEYYTATVFCHSSLIDAGLVRTERPDLVISEHVERFLISPPGTSAGFDIQNVISMKRTSVMKNLAISSAAPETNTIMSAS